MIFHLIFTVFVTFSWSQEVTSGVLYKLNSEQKDRLYTVTHETKSEEEGEAVSSVFKDLQGKTVVTEKGRIVGAKLLSYEIDRQQTQEKGRIRVEKGRVYFEYEGPGGKKRASDEKLKGEVVCAANFVPYIRSQWDRLNSGKEMDIRFAVWDRLETVGFTLEVVGEGERDGVAWVQVRMKPSSFLIAALVDPVHLWFAKDDKKLLQMKGRVPPKQQKGKGWEDLDAETVYQ